jgi:hypothetical protein
VPVREAHHAPNAAIAQLLAERQIFQQDDLRADLELEHGARRTRGLQLREGQMSDETIMGGNKWAVRHSFSHL